MFRNAARRLASSSSGLASPSAVTLANCQTLHELGVLAGEHFGERRSMGWKNRQGEWQWMTFAERAAEARQCARLWRSLGVVRGDRVAVISKNRVEWAACAYGTYGAGAAYVPCYEQQLPTDWEYILRDSGAKVLVVSRSDLLESALRAAEGSSVGRVLCFDDEGEYSFRAALAEASASSEEPEPPTEDDLATLIYTSGTTGKPKGVELTHKSLVWNAITMKDVSRANLERLGRSDLRIRSLSILPWAHIFGQSCELHALTAMGAEMALATDATTFVAEAGEIKPTILIAVPALYNRIYDAFEDAKAHMRPWQRKLADRAVDLGLRKARTRLVDASGRRVAQPLGILDRATHAILDRLVLDKIRQRLGGAVVAVASGGAAISTQVREFIEALGFALTSGYGLTETAPVLTSENVLDAANLRTGSVGVSLPGVDLGVVDEVGQPVEPGEPGELVVSTPGLMRGYWNKPDATREVVYVDDRGSRWFRTGDQCVLDLDANHVRVVGRIKEKYKLANGKYVVPTPIEEAFARSRFVAQAFLYGDNRPFNVALVAPDWTAVYEAVMGVDDSPIRQDRPFDFGPQHLIDELVARRADDIIDLLNAELKAHSACKSYEFPARWTVVTRGFTVARDMLTPKLSLRRNIVYREHEADIARLYADNDAQSDAPRVVVSNTRRQGDHNKAATVAAAA